MRVHFIAIGGSVMHQLALALLQKGYQVTGSDDEIFEPALGNLRAAGLVIHPGWDPEKIHPGLDAVILGMHAREDNPELLRARSLGLSLYSFPAYIARESQDKTRLVVGGSHGKTSTTAMIMHALRTQGLAFDYLVGAALSGFERSVQLSEAPLLVSEGDEYPASVLDKKPKFHFLDPHIAVLTGIAWDHINVFPSFGRYLEQFRIFIGRIQPGGTLIYYGGDENNRRVVADAGRKDIRYQPYDLPSYRTENGITRIAMDGSEYALQVFGHHNLLNLHAAYLACLAAGADGQATLQALSGFRGAAKRMELLAGNDEVLVFRDFAHAPSKLKATIEAVRQQFPGRQIVAAYELHTFSSLNGAFLPQYVSSMDSSDEAAVLFSLHALEMKRLPPLDPDAIRKGFGRPALQVYTESTALMQWLEKPRSGPRVYLLMSSGNFDGTDMLTFAQNLTGTNP